MSEIAGIITALVAALAAAGAGVKFIWGKVEGRFVKIEADLEECHTKHERSLERRAKQLTVIELMWAELERIAPGSAIFARVKRLLDELKPREGD